MMLPDLIAYCIIIHCPKVVIFQEILTMDHQPEYCGIPASTCPQTIRVNQTLKEILKIH